MSMTTFPSHVAAHTERSVSWWLLLVPLTFVAVGVTVLVVLTAAATGSHSATSSGTGASSASAMRERGSEGRRIGFSGGRG